MSGYRGRHGPNLHSYISNLNQVGFEEGQFVPEDAGMVGEALSMFTNTELM